jgi:tetratricopeptide (TPR) repeat protein
MELDMELDRIGGPDTAGMDFEGMVRAARQALERGFKWEAYGLFRDAVPYAATCDPLPRYRDADEQLAISQMNCATTAKSLGRYRYSLHEYLYLDSAGTVGPRFHPIILERTSGCYRALNNLNLAQKYADEAIREAEANDVRTYKGDAYCTRALIAVEQSDSLVAATYYRKAYHSFKQVGRDVDCVTMLNNLASCYLNTKRYRAARRASLASQRLSDALSLARGRAISSIILGEVDEAENRPRQASRNWHEAVRIAKELNDKELRFKAELVLFKQALVQRNLAAARAIERRLRRLSPWLPGTTEELRIFRRLAAENSALLSRSVPASQPKILPHSN